MIVYFLVMNSKRCKFVVGVNDSIFSSNEQHKVYLNISCGESAGNVMPGLSSNGITRILMNE